MGEIRRAAIERINQQIAEYASARRIELRDPVWDGGRETPRDTHTITLHAGSCAANVAIPDLWLLDYLTFSPFATGRLRAALDRLVAAERQAPAGSRVA